MTFECLEPLRCCCFLFFWCWWDPYSIPHGDISWVKDTLLAHLVSLGYPLCARVCGTARGRGQWTWVSLCLWLEIRGMQSFPLAPLWADWAAGRRPGRGWGGVGLGLAARVRVDGTPCWLWREREVGFSCPALYPENTGLPCLFLAFVCCGSGLWVFPGLVWRLGDRRRQPSKPTTSLLLESQDAQRVRLFRSFPSPFITVCWITSRVFG